MNKKSKTSEKSDDCCSNKSCCEMDVQKDCEYGCDSKECADKDCADKSCADESDSCCSGKGCCSEIPKLDISSLSSDAKNLNSKFESVQNHLEEALNLKREIITLLHKNQDKKEEFEKVLRSQHPVILQFVLELQ